VILKHVISLLVCSLSVAILKKLHFPVAYSVNSKFRYTDKDKSTHGSDEVV